MDEPSGGSYAEGMQAFRQWLRARRLPDPPPRARRMPLTLDGLAREAAHHPCVRRQDLEPGDVVVVRTLNSTYSLHCAGDGTFWVSGGWFDLQGLSPATVTVTGCTWGGSAIRTDVVAGHGLCLEFGNSVVTTRITSLTLIRCEDVDQGVVH
ncbi:MAG: hypothetical protein ACREAA_19250 [Candidatus Polarisedimenticolia bacterium]